MAAELGRNLSDASTASWSVSSRSLARGSHPARSARP